MKSRRLNTNALLKVSVGVARTRPEAAEMTTETIVVVEMTLLAKLDLVEVNAPTKTKMKAITNMPQVKE
jgi:hypothetical protein